MEKRFGNLERINHSATELMYHPVPDTAPMHMRPASMPIVSQELAELGFGVETYLFRVLTRVFEIRVN